MNTFLKSIKNIFMKNKQSSENKVSDVKENTSKLEDNNKHSHNPARHVEDNNRHSRNHSPVRQIIEKSNTDMLSEKIHSQFYPINK